MKKLLLVPACLILLSSCTLPFGANKTDESFTGLYKANIHSSIVSYEEIGTMLGINRHEKIDGSIRTAISVPGILSGTLTSEYAWIIDGRNSESFFRNIQVLFTSLVNSGSLSADELGLVSHNADSYISYKNINDVGIIPDQIKTIIKKYENTWLNATEQSVSDMSSDELMGYNIGKNLFTKSLSDIEKYATDLGLIKTETKIDIQPLDKRRQWNRGEKRKRGGPERTTGNNPVQAKEEREQKGLAELQLIYPEPWQIEDCRSYNPQVGCDARIWLRKELIARVDIKSGNRITDAQYAVALSSETEEVPYYIFNPDTGQAMLINSKTILVPKTFAVYAPS